MLLSSSPSCRLSKVKAPKPDSPPQQRRLACRISISCTPSRDCSVTSQFWGSRSSLSSKRRQVDLRFSLSVLQLITQLLQFKYRRLPPCSTSPQSSTCPKCQDLLIAFPTTDCGSSILGGRRTTSPCAPNARVQVPIPSEVSVLSKTRRRRIPSSRAPDLGTFAILLP